jgi:hypothetical protein
LMGVVRVIVFPLSCRLTLLQAFHPRLYGILMEILEQDEQDS